MGAPTSHRSVHPLLKFDPKDPHWPDRDRFVLSAGHGSMLLYSLLYLTGYEDMTIDQIKNFRQLGSKTAGHPEYGHAAGIETTTGPLGQGIANSSAWRSPSASHEREFGDDLVDHYTYVLAGDGCLMEGISQEAIALAGHLKLNKLIVFWDNNNISIDGPVSLSDSTDQLARFAPPAGTRSPSTAMTRMPSPPPSRSRAEVRQADADRRQDHDRLRRADQGGTTRCTARRSAPRKSPPRARRWAGNTEAFVVPSDVLDAWREAWASAKARKEWEARLAASDADRARIRAPHARRAAEAASTRPSSSLQEEAAPKPSRRSRPARRRKMALEVINGVLPETIGGSADLTGSNNTKTSQTKSITAGRYGRYVSTTASASTAWRRP
jgi:transketolase